MQFIRYRSMRAEQRRNKAKGCSSSTSIKENDDESVEEREHSLSQPKYSRLASIRFLIVFLAFINPIQFVSAQHPRITSNRVFYFLEKYHYPVIESTCLDYQENQMLSASENYINNIFFERFIIYSAIKKVIGDNTQINFQCVDDFENDNSDDPSNQYAGKFGSDDSFYLESDSYYMSVPSLHFEKLFVQKRGLKKEASFGVFEYLNYLFYLGIFLIPAVTGIILLLFKDLTTFYDYQRVVYSVYRYLNRQGDQQMNLWLHKTLSLTVAFFFFFYYSVLLSEMTAQRRFNFSSTDVNRDSFRDIQNKPNYFNVSEPIYFYLNVDSYQFHYLRSDYEINEDFIDSSINHYNVLLSKHHFTEDEYNSLQREILRYSAHHKSDNNIYLKNKFNNKSDDIYQNWIILGVGFLVGLIFKLLQFRFSSLNQYTEIQSYRDQVNSNIIMDYRQLFQFHISSFLANVQAKDHFQNFKQIPISKKCILLGKQVYKIIEKRRKKKIFRRKRKLIQNHTSNQNFSKQKLSLYQVIKGYLDVEKKGKTNVQAPRSTDSRRYAIQATLKSNPFSITNDQLFSNNDIPKSFQSQIYSNHLDKNSQNKIGKNENQPNSFNSLKLKPKETRLSIGIGGRLSIFNKVVGQSNFARRLSNLAQSADIPEDTPKHSFKGVNKNNNVLETIKHSNSKISSPLSKNNSPLNIDLLNGNSQVLQTSQFMKQDGSTRHRRRGTNNLLNPIQLLSLRKYDEDLTRKNNRRHSSYIGKKSKSLQVDIEYLGDEEQEENQNLENNLNGNNIHFEVQKVNGQEQHENSNDYYNIITGKNGYHQEQQNGYQLNKEDQNCSRKESGFKLENNFNDKMNTSQYSSNKINHNYDENLRFAIESPNALNTDYTNLNTNRDSQNDFRQTNRYQDSNRIELLLTEEKTQNDEQKISLNLFEQPTSTASRFLKTSPNFRDTSAFNNQQRENLFTEDELIGEGQTFKLQNLESIQSEYVKTPAKNSTFSTFQGSKK